MKPNSFLFNQEISIYYWGSTTLLSSKQSYSSPKQKKRYSLFKVKYNCLQRDSPDIWYHIPWIN